METVTCVWAAEAQLGEGPVWDGATATLYWIDIKGCRLFALQPDSGTRREWRLSSAIGCVAPAGPGRLLAALRSGFHLIRMKQDMLSLEFLGHPEADRPGNRFNDGKCDPLGRLWTGSMDDAEKEPTGSFWRLDPDRRCYRVDTGYAVGNGPAFSADGRTVFLTDSARRTVWTAPVQPDGSIGAKSVFLQFAEEDGTPDGMTVDAENGLWIARWGASRVSRYRADGTLDRSIPLPVTQVTSCAFGGPDLGTLYITSARKGLSVQELERQPLAGSLFAVQPGIKGVPAAPWAG
ncbi:SMP-30/gluconolactonase/LRE family protein [Indioceanicola profundi]|uniref:SMP-30/gluconolactonase/LRE family protein n=1 Tax=Indioceanicola profundi TaxID=2220096 RepID=UPI001CECEA75|nr:SMP-30/gluconolactonase/LRE family protein [Indioceanicola profundi]